MLGLLFLAEVDALVLQIREFGPAKNQSGIHRIENKNIAVINAFEIRQ